MQKKRLRIFAGPNGSGKSTLFQLFKERFSTGFFVNADLIENELRTKGLFDLNPLNIALSPEDQIIFSHLPEAISLHKKALAEKTTIQFELKEGFIVDRSKNPNSYQAAYIAAFIRFLLAKNRKTFSMETVLSHTSKIDEIKAYREQGYKTYLYYVCTDDAGINISRIENRQQKGGHYVSPERVEKRYRDSLANLVPLLSHIDQAYFFDNSYNQQLFAEIKEDKLLIHDDQVPNWFFDYVIDLIFE